jgi:hypothetical protein
MMTIMNTPNCRCSTFERIEELSQKLLAKSAIVRFADKAEDSKVAAGLIEQLRQAIVCYQVGRYYLSASSIVDWKGRYHNSKQCAVKSLTSR